LREIFSGDQRTLKLTHYGLVSSTANAKGAGGGLDPNFTLALRGKPESAARCLNRHADGAFVRIIHKLVEPDLRRGSNTKVALVIKLQARLAGASRFNCFVGVNTATSRKCPADAA
jgi:hypothetical protein